MLVRQLSVLIFALGLAACAAPLSPQPSGRQDATLGYPAVSVISGQIALQNLDAQLLGLERALATRPHDYGIATRYAGLLLARSQFRNRFSDLGTTLSLARRLREVYPERDETRLLLADTLAAVHRFGEALRLYGGNIDRAGSAPSARERMGSILVRLATGKVSMADVMALAEQAGRYPSYDSHSVLALAYVAVGRYDDADAAFVSAMQHYRDSSPLPLAWVAFQRGLMWGESANQPQRAAAHYRQALSWLPQYTVVAVHLAELERKASVDTAIARIEPVVARTSDAEAMGLLAVLLRSRDRRGDAARADDLVGTATARYEQLLQLHPEAFWDHAAEYFAGPGKDPDRALSLALRNVELRPTSRAYRIALRAASVAANHAAYCALASDALGLSYPSANLRAALNSGPRCQ